MTQMSGPSGACPHPHLAPNPGWEVEYRRWHSTPAEKREGDPPSRLICLACGRGVPRGAVELPRHVRRRGAVAQRLPQPPEAS